MIRPLILSVSCNRQFLQSRHRLLEEAGFEVTSVQTTYEAFKLLDRQSFDAVVVGESFAFTEKQLFAAEVGERWRIPVVVLYFGDTDVEFTADFQVELTKSADELISTLQSLITSRQKKSA
jgi:DNA-binding response OmpR family regulator